MPIHGQATSNVKQLDTPLTSQSTINYQLMDYFYNQDQNIPKYRELSGGIYPIILKHFETINYIENQCVKLRQKIDHDQTQRNQDQIQLIQQLAQLSAQKVKLAYQTLIEMRNERDQLIYKEYCDEHKNDSDILEKLIKVNNAEPFMSNEMPFTASSLLQNVMYNSFTGVNGVQNILPIKQSFSKNNEWKQDEKHLELLKRNLIAQMEEFGCNSKNVTLALQDNLCGQDITNYNLAFLSCYYGQKITTAKPQYDQANAVISAFSQIPPDEFQLQKRISSIKNKNDTLLKLQQKFIDISKEIEDLWRDVSVKKPSETKFVPEKVKIGQIVQFGNFPFFSSVECGQSIETTQSTMSTQSTAESSQDLSQDSESSQSLPEATVFDESNKQTSSQTTYQTTQATTTIISQQLTGASPSQQRKSQRHTTLQTVEQYIQSHQQPTKKCKPSCKLSESGDQMIQCASCEKCPFAKDGWWHISCLKLNGWSNFSQEFYCPGCWILKGNCFSDYVKNFDGLTSKQKDKVRESVNKTFIEEYGVKLKRV